MYPGHWSQQFPDKPAVILSTTGEAVSYKTLDDRSNQLAQLMWSRGIRPGDHVAIFMENNLRFFEVMWAAFRSGLYITTVNRYLTDEEAGYIVDDCEAKLLVSSAALADVAANLPRFAPNCSHWLAVDGEVPGYERYEDAIAAHPAERLEDEPAGQTMLYSSGTTGRPKGILRKPHTHKIYEDAGIVGALQKGLWDFNEDTIYLSPAHLTEVAGTQGIANIQLADGQTLTNSIQNVAEGKTDIAGTPYILPFLLSKGRGPYSKLGAEKGAELASNLPLDGQQWVLRHHAPLGLGGSLTVQFTDNYLFAAPHRVVNR